MQKYSNRPLVDVAVRTPDNLTIRCGQGEGEFTNIHRFNSQYIFGVSQTLVNCSRQFYLVAQKLPFDRHRLSGVGKVLIIQSQTKRGIR